MANNTNNICPDIDFENDLWKAAAIRLAVKKELWDKVKLSELNDIMADILHQAEVQYKN